MTQTPALIVDAACHIGENPLWHREQRRLYWCDIPRGRIYRYNPRTLAVEIVREGDAVGGFTIESDGALLLFKQSGAIARWNDGVEEIVVSGIERERESRFNDVIADPAGRVFCGTMSTETQKGRLYRLDPDGSLHVVVRDVSCSNGLAFSLDNKRLFYTDSFERTIYVFDYDSENGEIGNRRVLIKTKPKDGFPDGMTVDSQGCLWTAMWDGGCIVRYSPDGREMFRRAVPADKVTSLTFGGPELRMLFITTAGGEEPTRDNKFPGAVFSLETNIAGVPEFRSRIHT
jgi:D-xylonolactonase